MKAYIAQQCIKIKKMKGLDEAQEFYKVLFAKPLYNQFKQEVDEILLKNGCTDINLHDSIVNQAALKSDGHKNQNTNMQDMRNENYFGAKKSKIRSIINNIISR